MTEITLIQSEKVRAYLATDYRISHTSQDIVLTIGTQFDQDAIVWVGADAIPQLILLR